MNTEIEPTLPKGTQREIDLEAKLNKLAMWVFLFAFIALTELVVIVGIFGRLP